MLIYFFGVDHESDGIDEESDIFIYIFAMAALGRGEDEVLRIVYGVD